MNYREQLKKYYKQEDFNLLDLSVAYELDCCLIKNITDIDFNDICEYIKNIYLKDSSSNGVNTHTRAVLSYLENNTLENLLKIGSRDFLRSGQYYEYY